MHAPSPSACSSGISSGSCSPFALDSSASLYRTEGMGILVYDSTARYSDESAAFTTSDLRPIADKREVEHLTSEDRELYLSSLLFPPYKPRKVDYSLTIPPNSLRFDSHFEGGNLRKATKISDFEYQLSLSGDTNSSSHTQWYYFAVTHMRAGQTVKFSLTNLTKPESLYKQSMQPLIYSTRKEQFEHITWHRGGNEVTYQANSLQKPDKSGYFRTLSFTYRFNYSEDKVYFAHCYPYSYTDLRRDLAVTEVTAPPNTLRIEALCTSVTGNLCPLLTITNHVDDLPPWKPDKKPLFRRFRPAKPVKTNKKTVILTGRVHPGESNTSFILKGLINFLISDTSEANFLRKTFIFRIVPMLNPDGVIYGNTRCNILGLDLNRKWVLPNKLLTPTLFYLKKLAKSEGNISVYCDFHGHSVKKNAFIYGCCDPDYRKNSLIRLFPLFLQQKNRHFRYSDCKFQLEKEKEGTGRVVFFREMGVINSYTLETSFFGCGVEYFTPKELENLGRDFCTTMLALTTPKRFKRCLGEICQLGRGKSEGEEGEAEGENRDFSIEAALEVLDAEPLPTSVLSGCRETETKPFCTAITEEIVPETSPIRMRSRPQSCRITSRKPATARPPSNLRKPVNMDLRPVAVSQDLLQTQVSRIYAMLKFYKEAGCGKLLTGQTGSRPASRDFTQGRKSWVPQLKVRQQRPQSSGRQGSRSQERRSTRSWSRSDCF